MSRVRKEFVRGARMLLSVPFHQNCASPWGTDCIGLIKQAAASVPELNIFSSKIPDVGMLNMSGFTDNRMLDWLSSCEWVETKQPKSGDIVIWSWWNTPHHCGIVTEVPTHGPLTVIHAADSVGFVVEHQMVGEWSKRLVGIFTHDVLDC